MTAYGNRLECVILAHLPHGNRPLRSRKGFGAQQSMLWCAANPLAVRNDETMDCDKMVRPRNVNGYGMSNSSIAHSQLCDITNSFLSAQNGIMNIYEIYYGKHHGHYYLV